MEKDVNSKHKIVFYRAPHFRFSIGLTSESISRTGRISGAILGITIYAGREKSPYPIEYSYETFCPFVYLNQS